MSTAPATDTPAVKALLARVEQDHWDPALATAFGQAFEADDEGPKSINSLFTLWASADPAQRDAINDTVIALCGYGLDTLCQQACAAEGLL